MITVTPIATPIVIAQTRAPEGITVAVPAQASVQVHAVIGGPPGRQGNPGGPGLPGAAASSHVHQQSQPAAEWIVAHGMGRMPHVTLIDSARDLVAADVAYLDANTIAVSFTSPATGWAHLS